jgi:hypothetical protein
MRHRLAEVVVREVRVWHLCVIDVAAACGHDKQGGIGCPAATARREVRHEPLVGLLPSAGDEQAPGLGVARRWRPPGRLDKHGNDRVINGASGIKPARAESRRQERVEGGGLPGAVHAQRNPHRGGRIPASGRPRSAPCPIGCGDHPRLDPLGRLRVTAMGPLALSQHIPEAYAEQVAAITSGLTSLMHGAAQIMGGGRATQAMVEMIGGLMLVMAISDGSSLPSWLAAKILLTRYSAAGCRASPLQRDQRDSERTGRARQGKTEPMSRRCSA